VATVNSEILVGRQDDGSASVSVMRTRQASARLVGTSEFLDQLRNRLYVLGKLEGDDHGAAAKQ